MTNEQKSEFQQRRLSVLRRHVENDPKIRAMRRKRKRSMLASVLGSVAVFAVAMVLIKSFVLAVHGPQDFARIIAPMLEGQSSDSVPSRLLGPDPVSTEIAAALRPILPGRTQLAATGPEPVTPPQDTVTSEITPEL